MSDDIDRLKTQLEDFRCIVDGLVDLRDALKDVVAAVTPVELETDPEGHATLRDIATEVRFALNDLVLHTHEVHHIVTDLANKARCLP